MQKTVLTLQNKKKTKKPKIIKTQQTNKTPKTG